MKNNKNGNNLKELNTLRDYWKLRIKDAFRELDKKVYNRTI